jgi:Mrp family chromosome partitioning ATPase
MSPKVLNDAPVLDVVKEMGPALDQLWPNLLGAGEDQVGGGILFTSPVGGEGVSTVAACAALGLARRLGEPVTLVEVGGEHPSQALNFGVSARLGLAEVLAGEVDEEKFTEVPAVPGLRVLPAGGRDIAPGELNGDEAKALWKAVSGEGRHLIVDAPPVLSDPVVRLILPFMAGVVLVLRAGGTERDDGERALAALREAGTPVLGVVLNRYESTLPAWAGRRDWS